MLHKFCASQHFSEVAILRTIKSTNTSYLKLSLNVNDMPDVVYSLPVFNSFPDMVRGF